MTVRYALLNTPMLILFCIAGSESDTPQLGTATVVVQRKMSTGKVISVSTNSCMKILCKACQCQCSNKNRKTDHNVNCNSVSITFECSCLNQGNPFKKVDLFPAFIWAIAMTSYP